MIALTVIAIVALTVGIVIGRGDRRDAPVMYIEPRFVSRRRKA